MKLLETILTAIIVGAIAGFLVASLTLAFKKWREEKNAVKEIETYKDKFYVEVGKDKIPFAQYLKEQTLKNRQVKGGFLGLFKKNKQNAEDKFKQEQARVSNSASYYGEPTERVRSSNSSTSSPARNTSTKSGLSNTTKKETSDWDFH
ncbi:MAG: hypothetical protein WC711_04045 [Candidatus Staskawiczbacteria bacterium]|jgi:hypothetical protein